MFIQNFKSDKSNFWILYYLVLGILQALWTNLSAFPPMPLRLAMLIAMFYPAFNRKELVLFAVPYAFLLRGQLSTAYSFLPDVFSYGFYIGIIILLIIKHRSSLLFANISHSKSLLRLVLFFGIVDLAFTGSIGCYTTHLFIGLLLLPFFSSEKDLHVLSASLVLSCVFLSIYYLIMFDSFMSSWGSTGLERSGWKDPNYFSTLLDMGFVISLVYLFKIKKSELIILDRKFLAVGMCFIATAVALTASRAGFICLGVCLFISLFFCRIRIRHLILALIVIAGATYYMYTIGVFDVLIWRLTEQGNMDTGGDRTTIWKVMLDNHSKQPFFKQIIGGGYWHRAELTGGIDVHNEFLSVFADYGYIGEVLFIGLMLSMCRFSQPLIQNNIVVLFFFLSIFSLSPLQYINIVFLIIWIISSRWLETNKLPIH